MKVLSLFDGISCARVALARAGIPVDAYYASEIDKYAIQVSQKNYPDILRLGSVVDIRVRDSEHAFLHANCIHPNEHIDLLIGGSPCQDLSIAKQGRKGLDGDRSGLFWEYVRILHEVKPKWFVLENVASMPKDARDTISEALGVQPIMIDAALVSAQRRKRLFWTNIPGIKLPGDRGILLRDILLDGDTEDVKSLCITSSYAKKNAQNYLEKSDGQMVCVINPKMLNYKGDSQKCVTLTSSMYKEPPLVFLPVALRNRGSGKQPEYNGTDKANSLTTVTTDSMADMPPLRKLHPIECERLQGLPDNYTAGVSNTQRYKMLGNAFNVDVVAHILCFIPR